MVLNVNITIPATVEVKPGSRIEMIGKHCDYRVVYKVVENRSWVYIVTTKGTWHPVSAYGKTWQLSR